MKLRVLITGSTGMVGEGVLQVSLRHPDVERVVVINRRTCGVSHPKLTEIIHGNFFDLTPVAHRLSDLNACFFCLGVSSVNISEEKYYDNTYTLTMHFAETVAKQNPGMSFIYVSGAGTDSSERGRIRWARVKGKTENDLMKLPFKKAYAFRPGFMLPAKDAKNIPSWSRIMNPIFPVIRTVFPRHACTLEEVGLAMIHCVTRNYEKQVIEVPEILRLAKE